MTLTLNLSSYEKVEMRVDLTRDSRGDRVRNVAIHRDEEL